MDQKRKIMSECLVPDRVKPEHIRSVIIADEAMRNWVQGTFNNLKCPIISQPDMFFQPKCRLQSVKIFLLLTVVICFLLSYRH